jgi:tetratricopeptide (TPR) repeat protein
MSSRLWIVLTPFAFAALALVSAPPRAVAGQPDAAALVEEGKRFYAKEDYKPAAEAFEQAVNLAPRVSQYYVWLGRAYGRRAENTSRWKFFSALSLAGKARESFERAVELDNTNKEALLSLFDFFLEAPGVVGGGVEKAEQLAARIEKLFPADGARCWATIDEKRGEYDRAEEKLRLACRLEPGEVGHLLSLASFLSRRGRYQESDKLYEEALRLAPDSPEVWFSRGKALVRAGRNPAEARELLSRYLKANLPPDATPGSEARELLQQL